MNLSNSWFQGVVFTFVGAAIGWGISAYYAREAARDTEQQLALTREQLGKADQQLDVAQKQLGVALQQMQMSERQSRMMATLLVTSEERGLVKLVRDANGEITGGRVIELQGHARTKTSATGDLTVDPPAPRHND